MQQPCTTVLWKELEDLKQWYEVESARVAVKLQHLYEYDWYIQCFLLLLTIQLCPTQDTPVS